MRSLGFVLFVVLMSPFASAQSHVHESQPQKSDAQKSTDKAVPSDSQKSFDKLKTLAGSWEGHPKFALRYLNWTARAPHVIFRVTSMGHTLMHEMKIEGIPDNPITMLYVDGDRLLLTHYCDAGQPASHDREDVARRKDGGIRFSRYRRQHAVRTHASCRVHLHRRQPSHRGLDVHDAGGQADPRALRPAADKMTAQRCVRRVRLSGKHDGP